jgi:hypothetical protein
MPDRVAMTAAQERRRRLAWLLDDHYVPAWIERALCCIVGRGHTPIWQDHRGPQCAWCDAPVPDDAPDTVPTH